MNDKVQKFAQLGDNVKDIDVKFSKDGHLGGESIRVEITVLVPALSSVPKPRVTTSSRSSMKPTASSWSVCAVHVTAASCTSDGGKHPVSVADATGSIPRGYRSNYRDSAAGCSG